MTCDYCSHCGKVLFQSLVRIYLADGTKRQTHIKCARDYVIREYHQDPDKIIGTLKNGADVSFDKLLAKKRGGARRNLTILVDEYKKVMDSVKVWHRTLPLERDHTLPSKALKWGIINNLNDLPF